MGLLSIRILLTWLIAILLVPIFRIVTKWFLNKIGLWARNAWIIGSGKNAIDAFKAIQSEHNLGLNIIGYVDECDIENDYFKVYISSIINSILSQLILFQKQLNLLLL